MENQILDKRETYHVSIRKNNKQTQIFNRRKKFIGDVLFKQDINVNQQQSINTLNTMIEQITQLPQQQWHQKLQQIQLFIRDKNFQQCWSWLRLVHKIILVFREDYIYLNLTHLGSMILNLLIFKSTQQIAHTIIEYLMQNEICQQLLFVLKSKTVFQLLQQLYLLGNIISQNGNIRNIFVEKGIVPLIFAFLNVDNIQNKEVGALVWISCSIVAYYENFEDNLIYSIGNCFIQLFGKVISDQAIENSTKYQAIRGLLNIAFENKNEVKNIFSKQLLAPIIQFAQKQLEPSVDTWKLLLLFASSTLKLIPNQMILKNLPKLIGQIFTKNLIVQNNFSVLQIIQLTIYQLIVSTPMNCDSIMRSNVMIHILEGCNSHSLKSQLNSIRSLKAIIQRLNQTQTQYILKNHNILQIVTNNLRMSEQPKVKINCVYILQQLVQIDSNLIPNGVIDIVKQLQEHYEIHSIIQELTNSQKYKQVFCEANKLLQMIENITANQQS